MLLITRRRIIILFGCLIVILASIIIACHIWFHDLASKYLTSRLGVPVTIEFAQLNVINSHVKLEGVRILNPVGFNKGVLAVVNKIELDLNAKALLRGDIQFYDVIVDVKELRILNVPKYGYNLFGLKPFQENNVRKSKDKVDRLTLTLGKAVITDITKSRPVQRSFDLDKNRVIYHDVGGLNDTLQLVAWEILGSIEYEPLTAILSRLEKQMGKYNREESKEFFSKVVEQIKKEM